MTTPTPEEAHFLRLVLQQGGFVVKKRPGATAQHLLDRGLIHEVNGKWQVVN